MAELDNIGARRGERDVLMLSIPISDEALLPQSIG
jgi:hypothetical protein